jgi:hypothetical protein
VVNANATSNPDLWKAQKGASGNLGFVTRIDQRACSFTLSSKCDDDHEICFELTVIE